MSDSNYGRKGISNYHTAIQHFILNFKLENKTLKYFLIFHNIIYHFNSIGLSDSDTKLFVGNITYNVGE